MPEHPIEKRIAEYLETFLKFDSNNTRSGFSQGARYGYDAAVADYAKRLDAAEEKAPNPAACGGSE